MGDRLLHCDFCGKTQEEVTWLVKGHSANICDACLRLSLDTIESASSGQESATGPAPSAPAADAAILAVLERIEAMLVRWDHDGLPASREP